MPSRNIIRLDSPDSYYHVYARGINKQQIFLEPLDYEYFEKLFIRYLSKNAKLDKNGVVYPNYSKSVNLLVFCLMPNHFHLLLYQLDVGKMTKFMQSVMTSYSRYFNLKYKRTGPLFESRFKAAHVSNQEYLEHISRYIHLNPRYWERYAYSSLKYFKSVKYPEWLIPNKILELFKDVDGYISFLKDYEGHKAMLDEIKHDLANERG